ncbi:MAG: tetratricopeptide repeat protein [SAR324 cluster bacterium]|nr:tetratricopeptide repeat protein [SAR324 cluster bacterium]
MSDAEHMNRKELLQQNRLEKKLYAFADHAYRNKRKYISAAVSVVFIILGTWGGWKYMQSERINQANLFHIARSKISNPALSNEERLNQGIAALQEFARSESGSTLSVIALMESGEALARQSQIDQSISIFKDVINHPDATVFLRNSARLSLAALFEQQKRWDEADQLIHHHGMTCDCVLLPELQLTKVKLKKPEICLNN